MIGSKCSRRFFNQSEVKPKPILACACTFSRALCRLLVITASFDWFTWLSPPFLIGQSTYFGFGFTTLDWNSLCVQNVIRCTRISISVTKCPPLLFSPTSTSLVSRNTNNLSLKVSPKCCSRVRINCCIYPANLKITLTITVTLFLEVGSKFLDWMAHFALDISLLSSNLSWLYRDSFLFFFGQNKSRNFNNVVSFLLRTSWWVEIKHPLFKENDNRSNLATALIKFTTTIHVARRQDKGLYCSEHLVCNAMIILAVEEFHITISDF